MNNNELMKDKMNELKSREIILKKELADIWKKRNELSSFINRCAIFDESVIYYITVLLSYKENKAFVPFIYKIIIPDFASYTKDIETLHVGIAEGVYLTRFKGRYDFGTLFQQEFGFKIFKTDVRFIKYNADHSEAYNREEYIRVYYGNREVPEKSKKITFEFLLAEYGIENTYPVEVSHYNFEDYSYVQDYISYLFELQVQNDGRQLTYEEMQRALNDFLELEKDKPKQKIKEKDKES